MNKSVVLQFVLLFCFFANDGQGVNLNGWKQKFINKRRAPQKLNATYWKDHLGLVGHEEGGFFTEVYRSSETTRDLPDRFGNTTRTFGTAIYFLLTESSFSAFHVIKSDETWHFYHGRPLTIFVIDPNTGNLNKINLGPRENHRFTFTVLQGHIFAARLKNPRKPGHVLVGATVCPGFEYEDFQLVSRKNLTEKFPQHKNLISKLTRF